MAVAAAGALPMMLVPPNIDMGGRGLIEVLANDQSAIDGIYVFYDGDRNVFVLRRVEGTDYDEVTIDAGDFEANDEITIGAKWTADTLFIAKQGDLTFTSAPSSRLPQGTMGMIKFGTD